MKKTEPIPQSEWEKTDTYKMAVMLKVMRAMKNYGYCAWMTAELKKIGISL
jgi:hypothetical protein